MNKGRLEAFSDGVLAIVITIMVLNLHAPAGATPSALGSLLPEFLGYLLSFVFIGIYWNNHHHLLQAARRVNGSVLWANLHLLFWLTLVPFTTGWMGAESFAALPVALYGFVLLMAAFAFYLLLRALVALHGADSALAVAVGRDIKGKISPAIYLIATPLAFANRWIALALYALVAVIWLVPDRRIERTLTEPED